MIRARGFTLIELIVAMAIFALIAAGAYTALFAVLDARESTKAQSERLAAVQYAVGAIVGDLRQAVERPVRSIDPQRRGSLYAPGTGANPLLVLTRGGSPNPAGLARSNLTRVRWYLVDEGLERSVLPRPDASQRADPPQRRLLERVESVELRFLGADGEWDDRWPPLNAERAVRLPRAVEVTFELMDWGAIERLVALPAGSGSDRDDADTREPEERG